MATSTTNYGLTKPTEDEYYDINIFNDNADIIDENLGKITQPTYTDTDGNKYADINGMHLRTDNSIYAEGGIKVVNCDPCVDGENITEADIDSRDNILAKIDSSGNSKFNNVDVTYEVNAKIVKADSVRGDSIYTEAGTRVTGRSVHFEKVKGAVYADNSSEDTEDGSRKLIVGAYHDTPEVDDNYIPATEPDAGIIARVESDDINNGTYLDLYADQVVCRNEGAEFKAGTVRADTVRGDVIRAGTTLKIGGDSVADLLDEKASLEQLSGIHKTYYVASSTSARNYKNIADIIIESTDDIADTLNSVLTKTSSNNTDEYVVASDYDRIYLCPGDYTLNSQLKISKSNVIIEGHKNSKVSIGANGQIRIGTTTASNTNSLALGIILKGFTLDCNTSNPAIFVGSAADSSCKNICLEELYIIRNTDTVAIYISSQAQNVQIKNNVFYKTYDGDYTCADIYFWAGVLLLIQGNTSATTYPINFGADSTIITLEVSSGTVSEKLAYLSIINQGYIDIQSN